MRAPVLLCLCLLGGGAWARELTEKDVPFLDHYRQLRSRLSQPESLQLNREKRAVEAATTCSRSKATGCLKTFLAPLQLSSLPANPQSLLNALFQYYQSNMSPGYISICTQLESLQTCMGLAQWSSCFSTLSMVQSLGFSYAAALQYTSILNSLPYACSTAVNPILNKWTAVSQVLKGSQANLTQCINNMNTRIASSPNAACAAYQSFVACYAIPFHASAGENVAYSVCQTIRRGLLVSQPQCTSLTCSYVSH